MGMFDSFRVNFNNKDFEIQTKKFNCNLNVFNKGDWTPGFPPGVSVFFDAFELDEEGNICYNGSGKQICFFAVFYDGIFIHYEFFEFQDKFDDKVNNEYILEIIKNLEKIWSDTNKVHHEMIQIIIQKQNQIRGFLNTEGKIVGIIKAAKKIRDGEQLNNFSRMFDESLQKLHDGQDVLELLSETIESRVNLTQKNHDHDPLEIYRL